MYPEFNPWVRHRRQLHGGLCEEFLFKNQCKFSNLVDDSTFT